MFSAWLQKSRINAGFTSQLELADALGIRQQTVSRWESGSAMPRGSAAGKLASVLRLSIEEVKTALGRAPSNELQETPSFANSWPFEALTAVDFERLCAALAELLYVPAKVNLRGKSGDEQDGIDIDIVLGSGKRVVIQCKRVAHFGPAAAQKAISAAAGLAADTKVLCLAAVAGAPVRKLMESTQGWELWDREDLTRKIKHSLTREQQHSLVSRFFPGRRFELTGEADPSPWFTPEDFFASNEPGGAGLPQMFTLVGRSAAIDDIKKFLDTTAPNFLFLEGNAGSGKTRLLKEVATMAQARTVRYLSKESLTSRGMETLPSGPKVLICDDAHERDDLGLLVQYAADPTNQAQVILGLRSYGRERVMLQTRVVTLERTQKIEVGPLKKGDARLLAQEALSYYEGHPGFAEDLALYTRDCPLGTVVGARVLAKNSLHPQFLKSDDAFNSELMRQFVNTTVDEVSTGLDRNAVGKVLAACALLQPISDTDEALVSALATEFSVDISDIHQVFRQLHNAGVLFRRGPSSRVSPDLLADFLIEEYFTLRGRSNGLAERFFRSLSDRYAENILVNLGRLDWRVSKGATSGSVILQDLWSTLEWGSQYFNPHAKAASAVAVYQPEQALNFAERMMNAGHSGEVLGTLIRNAALNPAYLERCCQLLWRLGADDSSRTNQKPGHGVRVLAELAAPEPDKPISYSETLVDFGLYLLSQDDNWNREHSPWEILEAVLATDGTTTTSRSFAILLTPFLVSPKVMHELRAKIIDAALKYLAHPDPFKGTRAARVFAIALRYPMRGSDDRDDWENEFCETLGKLVSFVKTTRVSPVVLTALAESVSWHAHYGGGRAGELANEVIARLDVDLRSRTLRTLLDGHNHLTRRIENATNADLMSPIQEVADSLITQISKPAALLAYIEGCLEEISAAHKGLRNSSPQALLNELFNRSPALCKVLLQRVEATPEVNLRWFAGNALARLLEHDRTAASEFVQRILLEGDGPRLSSLAEAYWMYNPGASRYNTEDKAVLDALVTSIQPGIHGLASGMLRQVSTVDEELAIGLLLKANIGLNSSIADGYLTWVTHDKKMSIRSIGDEGIKLILSKIQDFTEVNEFWLQEFFKKVIEYDPEPVIKFFLKRIDAADGHDYHFQPCPAGHYKTASLSVRTNSSTWALYILDWARQRSSEGKNALGHVGELMASLFGPFDSAFVALLENWAVPRDNSYMSVLLAVVRQADPSFAFKYDGFILRLMRWAQTLGDDILNNAISTVHGTTWRGGRAGVPGEPFPQDLELLEKANQMLGQINRFEPAYRLYKLIVNLRVLGASDLRPDAASLA